MKAIKRWKYYCDFCKKSGGNKGIIAAHEKSCTNNLCRVCKMCEVIGDPQPDLARMVGIVKRMLDGHIIHTPEEYGCDITYAWCDKETEPLVIKKLWSMTDCHVCILAALRQSGYPFLFDSFKFKEINDEFWAQKNMDEEEALYHSACG